MATALQHEAPTLSPRIQATSTGKHHPYGGQKNDALTFETDQSVGAGQRTGQGPCSVEPGKTIMRTALLLIPNLVLASQLFWTNLASAASGPLAEGFGRDAWLDKLHVVGGVVLLVAALTVFLVLMILKSR